MLASLATELVAMPFDRSIDVRIARYAKRSRMHRTIRVISALSGAAAICSPRQGDQPDEAP